ncbi:hypothetical protein RBSWK_06583 [Rhodopirellula baltica SWK14]|uniref:Uncharacterized protein n=1 Tax=Rhodopirellula baltica SWK14 TaxID=993516 RepID=L7C8U2_RHOBT|nr:hypothetical protein RBSWK_06583 [Rhodopirellula baltica SWK14]
MWFGNSMADIGGRVDIAQAGKGWSPGLCPTPFGRIRNPDKSHGQFKGFGERSQSPVGRKDRLNPSCGIQVAPT